MVTAAKAIEAHLKQLHRLIERRGVAGIRKIYLDARKELQDRLLATKAPSTQAELRALLAQTEAVLSSLGKQLFEHTQDISREAAMLGAQHGVAEYKVLAKQFTGTVPILSVDRAAIFRGLVAERDPSLLTRHKSITSAWRADQIARVERELSNSVMTGRPLHETINRVAGKLGVLSTERWKAERIVRTEAAYAHGAVKQDSMQAVEEELEEPLQKRWIETFDDRTGDDSFLMHGQTVPVGQPFTWKRKKGFGWVLEYVQHPPNRPHDRAVVIPWNPKWEAKGTEKPLTQQQLRSARTTRWRKQIGVDVPPGHVPGQSYVATKKTTVKPKTT